MARLDHLRSHRSLLLRLVRQHRAAHDVADGVDVRLVRAQIRVHLHEAALVHLHARLLQTQALRVGHAAHAHQHRLRLQRLLLSVCTSPPLPSPTLAALHAQLHARLRHLAAQHLRAQLELHSLLRQALLQRRRHVRVVRSADVVQELHHLHLRAQAAPHRTQLQTDHAAAHHDQALRDLAQLQRTRAVDDALLRVVHRKRVDRTAVCTSPTSHTPTRTRSQNDVRGLNRALTSRQQLRTDRVLVLQTRSTLDVLHSVLLE